MEEVIACLRCGGEMRYIGREDLQKGKFGWVLGALDNLVSGALAVDIYCCRQCRRLEFYAAEASVLEEKESGIAQIPCPGCGYLHDADDSKCPCCGRRLFV